MYRWSLSTLCFIRVTFIAIVVTSILRCAKSDSSSVSHITFGSTIKLESVSNPSYRLHSHDIKYGSGSGQQSVTAASENESSSYWTILKRKDGQFHRGEPIECGSEMRLQHTSTKKFLHSHLFKSPMSNHQEVSAFGDDNESDTGDVWLVHCKEKYWNRQDIVKLKHKDTEAWLSLSGNTYGRPINGQLEVVANVRVEQSSLWRANEGIYISQITYGSESVQDGKHDEL